MDREVLFSIPCSDMPTLNCFELTYDGAQKYRLSVETIYEFEKFEMEFTYYNDLLDAFTDWMKKNGYPTPNTITPTEILNPLFDEDGMYFKSIPESYAWFRFIIKTYCVYIYDPYFN